MAHEGEWQAPDPMLRPCPASWELTNQLTDIHRFTGRWERLRDIKPDRLERLRHDTIVESASSSVRIEGATISDDQVREILNGIGTGDLLTRDAREVEGYIAVLDDIDRASGSIRPTESDVKGLHFSLLQYVDQDAPHRGDYKRVPNNIAMRDGTGRERVLFATASPFQTTVLMPRLLAEFHEAWEDPEWNKLVLIADFILWFLMIHPFQDGNGRLSRALTTLLLRRVGYEYQRYSSLERVIENNRSEYYAAILAAERTAVADPTQYRPWLEFFLQSLKAQQENLERRLSGAGIRAETSGVEDRILDAVQTMTSASSSQVALHAGIPARTARYNLHHLVERGLLRTVGERRGRRYRLSGETVAVSHGLQNQSPAAPRREAVPPEEQLLDGGPKFMAESQNRPNTRAYATLVVGGVPEGTSKLTDTQLDSIDAAFRSARSDAHAYRSTPDGVWWRVTDADPADGDRWQGWAFPGPVVTIISAMEQIPGPADGVSISFREILAFWRVQLPRAMRLATDLGACRARVALLLQTYPGSARVLDLALAPFPVPVQGAPPWDGGVSPWRLQADHLDIDEDTTLLQRDAAASLLRHFSYRHLEATLNTAFGTVNRQ